MRNGGTMEFWDGLMCPVCKQPGLRLSTDALSGDEMLPEHGYAVCDNCKRLYPIAEHILDMAAHEPRPALTLAGWSNHFPPTPQLYERIWRRRALTLMTGEAFSVERELNRMNEWAQLQAGEYAVDLGTSTGLYARGVKPAGVTVVAVDLAWEMLREARGYIAREKRSGIVLMRAAAESLPLRDESMDAVLVGGSLNEMQGIPAALREAHRVTRRGGRMFVMSLSRATKNPGKVLQGLAGLSGIKFPGGDEFSAMAQGAGWNVAKQEQKGIVLFSLLVK